MKVAFATLGCRVNTYESEAMTEKFVREGYEVVDFNEMADVYVVNTCSVTNMGDKKSRQIIGRARRQNPEAIIAVVGCYAQIAPTEVSGIEGVDVVLGSRNKGEIVYYVNKARDEGKQQVKVGAVLKNKVFEDLKIEEYNNKTRAFLKIQDGCNRFCAYCLIPYTRGSVCSKDPKKVLEEIRNSEIKKYKRVIEKQNNIELRIVDRFYPSSKTCSQCGEIKKDLKLSDRVYKCSCGLVIDRDLNASINLRNAKEYKIA